MAKSGADIKLTVNADEAIKALKAVRHEARETVQALKELESVQKEKPIYLNGELIQDVMKNMGMYPEEAESMTPKEYTTFSAEEFTKKESLEDIALELLDKYEEDEGNIIHERSTNMHEDWNRLGEEVEQYRRRIEAANK